LSALVASLLAAATVIAVGVDGVSPAGACPPVNNGHWSGSFSGVVSGTWDAYLQVNGGAVTGTASTSSGITNAPVSGSYSCGVISFGVVSGISFSGTISPDGESMNGSWSLAPFGGTYTGSYQHSLDVQSSVDPSSVTAGGASVWTIDVTNLDAQPFDNVTVNLQNNVADVSSDSLLVDYVPSQGSCTDEVGVDVRCDLGPLLSGSHATITVTVATTGVGVDDDIVVNADAHAQLVNTYPEVTANSTIHVVASNNTPGQVSGQVDPGQTIRTGTVATPGDNTIASFKLPKKTKKTIGHGTIIESSNATTVTGPPVAMAITTDLVDNTFCGGQPCIGKLVTFSPFKGYTDPLHPATITITYDATVAGNGIASTFYVRYESSPNTSSPVPRCPTKKHGLPKSECLASVKFIAGHDLRATFLVTTGDPVNAKR
jgi:hypothetical protein